MATEKANSANPLVKFLRWYESYPGQRAVGIVYSVGAAVVILGALFKIQHYPGASTMLNIGMGTEVLLFLIGVMDKPHPSFHWEEVFPQLVDEKTVPVEEAEKIKTLPRPDLAAATGGTAPVAKGQTAQAAKVPSLKDEDFQALKDSINDLAKTATQFSELGKVAQTGVKLGEKLAAADQATGVYVDKLSAAGQATEAYTGKLSAAGKATEIFTQITTDLTGTYNHVSDDMKSVATETKAYKESVNQMGQKIASLNSVYELQLQAANAQVEAQKSAAESAKEVAEVQAAYLKSTKQLEKQIADLNGIYGNMLNALA